MYTKLEFRHYDSYTGGGCRVYENGQINRKLTAGGCGYDREGTAFGNWMMAQPEIAEAIKHLTANSGSLDTPTGYYGLSHYNSKTRKWQKRASKNTRSSVDGACGFRSMQKIMEALGYRVEHAGSTKNSNFYIVEGK